MRYEAGVRRGGGRIDQEVMIVFGCLDGFETGEAEKGRFWGS